jgi:hypothetical protein
MRKQDKADQSFITAEQFIEKKDQQAKRDHFVRRLQLERDLARTANVASKMAACVEALVGGDRKVLELFVSSFASTSNEMIRIYNLLGEFYHSKEKKNANKAADH